MYFKEVTHYIFPEVTTVLSFEDGILRTKILRKVVTMYLA